MSDKYWNDKIDCAAVGILVAARSWQFLHGMRDVERDDEARMWEVVALSWLNRWAPWSPEWNRVERLIRVTLEDWKNAKDEVAA